MNTTLPSRAATHGIMLVEAIVYMAILTIVLGVGSALLYRAWDTNIALRRNSDDIVRALNAGELWRADIRSATGSITTRDGHEVHMRNSRGEIIYRFADGKVTRNASGQQPRILTNVKSSEMLNDPRNTTNGWRWELELNHNHKKVQFRPLFTFDAVAKSEVGK